MDAGVNAPAFFFYCMISTLIICNDALYGKGYRVPGTTRIPS